MSVIRNIRKEPTLLRLLFVILTVIGFLLMTSFDKIYWGMLLFTTGFGFFTSTATSSGIEIIPEKKMFRQIHSFFGIISGTWNTIPETEYLSVFKAKESRQFGGYGTALTNYEYIVYSFNQDRKPVTIYKTSKKLEAFKIASQIADLIDTRILDTTEKEQKWIS